MVDINEILSQEETDALYEEIMTIERTGAAGFSGPALSQRETDLVVSALRAAGMMRGDALPGQGRIAREAYLRGREDAIRDMAAEIEGMRRSAARAAWLEKARREKAARAQGKGAARPVVIKKGSLPRRAAGRTGMAKDENGGAVHIRKAGLADIGKVADLLASCFGNLAVSEGALSWFLDRYHVAVTSAGDVVGMSGIVPEDGHLAVTFTCVDERHRGRGIADALFSRILDGLEGAGPVALCAWHLQGRDRANLDGVARRHGFVLEHPAFVSRVKGISPGCRGCIYGDAEACRCCDDLYVLRR